MLKNTYIHLFSAFFFSLIIVSPALYSLLDDAPQISIVLDVEEEENKAEEVTKDVEYKQEFEHNAFYIFSSSLKEQAFKYYSSHYTAPLQELNPPPPELS